MPLIIAGLILIAARLLGCGPLADVDWWWFLVPFGLAAAWWAVADATGLTQRRAMQKMDERKTQRRDRQMAQLGLDTGRKKQVDKSLQSHARRSATVNDSAGNRPARPKEPHS